MLLKTKLKIVKTIIDKFITQHLFDQTTNNWFEELDSMLGYTFKFKCKLLNLNVIDDKITVEVKIDTDTITKFTVTINNNVVKI